MLGIFDSVIIVISLALVVGAVLRAAGKKQTDAEYFLAGRDLRWPFIGMSLLASNISAEHVVGMAGDGYRVGMVTGGYEWMAAWCLIILASSVRAAVSAQQDLHHSRIPRAALRMGPARLPLRQSAGDERAHQERHRSVGGLAAVRPAVRLEPDGGDDRPVYLSRPSTR